MRVVGPCASYIHTLTLLLIVQGRFHVPHWYDDVAGRLLPQLLHSFGDRLEPKDVTAFQYQLLDFLEIGSKWHRRDVEALRLGVEPDIHNDGAVDEVGISVLVIDDFSYVIFPGNDMH